MRWITVAAEYDQLDVTNLACFELIVRFVQSVGWCYLDKVRDAAAGSSKASCKGSSTAIAPEELAAFSGAHPSSELCMICPALLEHVKSTTEKEASILKSVRQARLERAAHRSGKDVPGLVDP